MRVDSGFWSNDTIATLGRLDVRYTMAVRTNTKGIAAAIAAIDEDAWVDIDYTPTAASPSRRERLHHRQRPPPGDPPTDRAPHPAHRPRPATAVARLASPRLLDRPRPATPSTVDPFHRHHAVVELAIRDLKEGAGLDHVPSGNFHANSAWLQCAVLAHNLIRWTAILGNVPSATS